MGLQRKNHGLTPGGVGGHDRIRHHIRRDRERLVVNKLAVNGGARGVQHLAAAGSNNNGALGGARCCNNAGDFSGGAFARKIMNGKCVASLSERVALNVFKQPARRGASHNQHGAM